MNLTLWTTVPHDSDLDDIVIDDTTYLWNNRQDAQDNADAGGHVLVKVRVTVVSAEVD